MNAAHLPDACGSRSRTRRRIDRQEPLALEEPAAEAQLYARHRRHTPRVCSRCCYCCTIRCSGICWLVARSVVAQLFNIIDFFCTPSFSLILFSLKPTKTIQQVLLGKGDTSPVPRLPSGENAYTTALEVAPDLLPVLGNRSACYLQLGESGASRTATSSCSGWTRSPCTPTPTPTTP